MLPRFILAGLMVTAWLPSQALGRGIADWHAPEPAVVADRLSAEVGLMWAQFSTDARVDENPDELGDVFNAEDDLGLAKSQFIALPELTLYPGKRHLIRLNAVTFVRHAQSVLSRDILYSGDVYQANELVISSLDLRFYGLTYGYRFVRRERFNVAATLGVEIVDFKTNAEIPGEIIREATGDVAPVPVVGLEGNVIFGRRWVVEARAQYTSVSTDEVDGSFLDARLAVVWQMNPHLGFGLGYRLLDLDAESFSDDSAGIVNLKVRAPNLFMRASF